MQQAGKITNSLSGPYAYVCRVVSKARALLAVALLLVTGFNGFLRAQGFSAFQNDSLPQLPDGLQYREITGKIHFKRSSVEIVPSYLGNDDQLAVFKEMSDSFQNRQLRVVGVNVTGSASPEGKYGFNAQLSQDRAASLKRYLAGQYPGLFADSLEWNVEYRHEDWSQVEELLKKSGIEHRDQALEIIWNTPSSERDSSGNLLPARKLELQKLYDGDVWNQMDREIFPYCRGAEFRVLVTVPSAGARSALAGGNTVSEPSVPVPQEDLSQDPVVQPLSQGESDTLPKLPDGLQYRKITSKIHFKRSSTELLPSYLDNERQLQVIREMTDSFSMLKVVDVKVTGSASPEGSFAFNVQLSVNRAARLKQYLVSQYPDFFADSLQWDVRHEYEDWSYVEQLLEKSDIRYRDQALEIIRTTPYSGLDSNGNQVLVRKQKLKQLQGGTVWQEMDRKIFPYSRGAELQIIVIVPAAADMKPAGLRPSDNAGAEQPHMAQTAPATADTVRQPMLALKTNLLYYGAYVPNYGYAPIPNVAVEFLPRHGKWTVGASLDMPWQQNYSNHKFMQIRNWQIEGRRYFGGEDAQFWGWYAQAYIHTGVFGIGFNKKQGWEGESLGAGLGGGYVLPISRNNHWKLEFNLQLGYMRSQYDPYVYGHPTNGEEDGLYYYDWKYDPELFKERQYRHTWIGPTRIGVTLSYDLLYYRNRNGK